ncbi:hypothetical protein ACFC1R_06185 [Kitasatospora sp. NPDC056138]|uniref:hypothetical protein n=1 Tax=Kitasatospora sp. NPDC056138 TaxID=3345724 RepID=UPI0035DDE23E
MFVLGVLLMCSGCVGFTGALGDFRRSAGLTGGSGRMHFGTCWANKPTHRSVSYDCFGDVTPLSAAPRAEGGLVVMKNVSENRQGRHEQVDCTPTGTCIPAGTHAALGNAMLLCLTAGMTGGGLSVILVAVAGRRTWLLDSYGRHFRRAALWGFGALGTAFVGLLIPYWAT